MTWREKIDKVACAIFRVLRLGTSWRFRRGRWERYRLKSEELPLTLLSMTTVVLVVLILGISYRFWGLILIAVLVIPVVVILDAAYGLWWLQEGRHGMECPWLDADITQNENLTSIPSEEDLRRMNPPDVHREWNNRM